jgi:hypothetical protein
MRVIRRAASHRFDHHHHFVHRDRDRASLGALDES